ncbi:MAG: hypothetical protein JHC98_03200 [Thermoleophilaceae bacterium]|nr:hypothetical protein [Thermoleophilaceae bacterium]
MPAVANSIATAPDGRVYVAGRVDFASDRDISKGYEIEGDDGGELNINRFHFVVHAYSEHGRAIKSFGDDGKLLIKAPTDWSGLDAPAELLDIGVAPDGSLYVLYEDNEWKYRLVHLDRRGHRVRGFGGSGVVRLNLPKGAGTDELTGARVFPDVNGAVVTYTTTSYKKKAGRALWGAQRFDRYGRRDRGYGTNGAFSKTWPLVGKLRGSDLAVESVLDASGRIVFAGTNAEESESRTIRRGAVIRVLTNGRLDRSFGNAGIFSPVNHDGTPKYVESITSGSDGRYVLAAARCIPDPDEESPCTSEWSTMQIDSDGKPLLSWGANGEAPISGDFGGIKAMLSAKRRVYIAFGRVYSANERNPRFGVTALFE